MVSRRTYGSYNDGCASAHALDLVGDRWALLVVRELLLGPKRFVDIHRDLSGIGPAVLSQRLHGLEVAGIVMARTLPAPAHVPVYELTEWGRGLEGVNAALSLWASSSPQLPVDADMSPDALVLAMRAHAPPLPPGAGRARAHVALNLTDSRDPDREPVEYVATIAAQGAAIEKNGLVKNPVATISTDTRTWKSLIVGGATLEACAGVTISGDVDAVRALLIASSVGGGRVRRWTGASPVRRLGR